MNTRGRAAAVLSFAALLALPAAATSLARTYPESPPVAHTGGFGEPTCHACHFDYDPDMPDGVLTIEGLPEVFDAGQTYRLMVVLTRTGMGIAGFELAARFAEGEHAGTQAGVFEPTDDRTEITPGGKPAVSYVHHTRAGTALAAPDTARWSLRWTAPATGNVIFHVAANAANDDASPFSDHVYTAALAVASR
jgi:hypothetical protein